jgi:hypothetical protein
MARHERAFGPLKAGGRRVEWYRYGVTSKVGASGSLAQPGGPTWAATRGFVPGPESPVSEPRGRGQVGVVELCAGLANTSPSVRTDPVRTPFPLV